MKEVKPTYEMLINQVKTYINNPESLVLIEKAYNFANKKHNGQMRKSGEPYVTHLIAVAYYLSCLENGPVTIVAGLLHDVVEDTDVSVDDVKEMFGEEVAFLVDSVTKVDVIEEQTREDYEAENHRKIFIAMCKDIRVILIKLLDRLHNMRTLKYQSAASQVRIAKETLGTYVPIAHRLGLSDIKTELEDRCLYYMDHDAYTGVKKLIDMKLEDRISSVTSMIEELQKDFDKYNIPCEIKGRAKHIYSIYNKMEYKKKRFEEIYDLYAIRIISKSKLHCYEILGIIHDKYRPIPGRFKDYIAMPKPNLYQSLHTTIIGHEDNIFEIQIRTEEMDQIAEKGIAAHWRYKEGIALSYEQQQKEIEDKLQWFREFVNMADEIASSDAKSFFQTMQRDIFEANVYVLTPAGKVIELPNLGTPIDFAYKIHTDVGHQCVGAIVNGAMVPLNTALKTGDVVEIKTLSKSSPSEDWLRFVKTASAKNKIKQFLQQENSDKRRLNIDIGTNILKEEIKRRNLDEKKYFDNKTYEKYYASFGASDFEDILNALGNKTLGVHTLINKVDDKPINIISKLLKFSNKPQTKLNNSLSGVQVEGIDNIKTSLSKCCNPIPGDQIVGFVSKGEGVKIHRSDCANVQTPENKIRLINVRWESEKVENVKFNVDLKISAYDRPFLLGDVATVLSQYKVVIINLSANVSDTIATFDVAINIKDVEQLTLVMENLKKIPDIYEIKRVSL